MNKKILLSLLLITGCSTTVGNFNDHKSSDILSVQEINILDKEHSFSTKALTKNYLKDKLTNLLNKGNLLVREISYARLKHPELFCTIMSENSNLQTSINNVAEVSAKKANDPIFKSFVEACSSGGTGTVDLVNGLVAYYPLDGEMTIVVIIIMVLLLVQLHQL